MLRQQHGGLPQKMVGFFKIRGTGLLPLLEDIEAGWEVDKGDELEDSCFGRFLSFY